MSAALCNVIDDISLWRRQHAPDLIGNDLKITDLLSTIRSVAQTSATVLITGESGTGKELVAKAVHSASERTPFVAINCAALHNNLIESELFGHIKGSFTGAATTRNGAFVEANGGTLFLDEIGDMEQTAQAKLLRVLQERAFNPVGSDRTVQTNVRIIASTNRPLEDMVKDGGFRGDLLYRLNVIRLAIPPLRARVGDILPIAGALLDHFLRLHRRPAFRFTNRCEAQLLSHDWPGNIRELSNVVERAFLLNRPIEITSNVQRIAPSRRNMDLSDNIKMLEKSLIEEAMKLADGNRTRAAAMLGLNRTTLCERLRKIRARRPILLE